ncbi:MAG: hypothetical protein AAGD43_16305 [Pseudomonadota bacterium]
MYQEQARPNIARGPQARTPPAGMAIPSNSGLDHYHIRFTDREFDGGEAKAIARSSRPYAQVILASIAVVSLGLYAYRMLT